MVNRDSVPIGDRPLCALTTDDIEAFRDYRRATSPNPAVHPDLARVAPKQH